MKLEQIYAKQEKLVKRRRRGKAVCLAVMAAGFAICLYSIARLVPIYGAWARENRHSLISMCRIDTPAYLELDVMYDSPSPPVNLQIVHDETGTILRNLGTTHEDGVMHISCDIGPDMPSGNWSVRIIPGGNRKISCQADVYPSYRYIDGHAYACRDSDGHIWLCLSGRYDRSRGGRAMSVAVKIHGSEFAETLYDVQANTSIKETWLDLTALATLKSHGMQSAMDIEILMTAEYDPPEDSDQLIGYAKYQTYIMPDDIPACEHESHDSSATDDYIERTVK